MILANGLVDNTLAQIKQIQLQKKVLIQQNKILTQKVTELQGAMSPAIQAGADILQGDQKQEGDGQMALFAR